MQTLIIIFHIVISFTIIGLVLLQRGKGAEMGASFGSGASQTVFGSQGSTNFIGRITAVLVALFFASSLGLAYLNTNHNQSAYDLGIPGTTESQSIPAETQNQQSASDHSDLPPINQQSNTTKPTTENSTIENQTKQSTPINSSSKVGSPTKK